MQIALKNNRIIGGVPDNFGPEEGEILVPAPEGVDLGDVTLEYVATALGDSIPFEERQSLLVAAIQEKRNRILGGGFAHDFGGTVGVKTLQTDTDLDRSNWLSVFSVARHYADLGLPDEPMNPLIAVDNTAIPVTAQQTRDVLLMMQAFFGRAIQNGRALKDQAISAATHAELDAIDLSSGW